jgi:hypothetical protein
MSDNFPEEICRIGEGGERKDWPDPTPEMLVDPHFEAIWQTIKTWDINVPAAYGGYCRATGNHVRAILDALSKSAKTQ